MYQKEKGSYEKLLAGFYFRQFALMKYVPFFDCLPQSGVGPHSPF